MMAFLRRIKRAFDGIEVLLKPVHLQSFTWSDSLVFRSVRR
jgi:hypothetical protein